MAVLDDSVTIALLASAAFFVALSFGLLLRYRQVSQRMSASSDLGRDLWGALEQRMKKQDERILDMMGRLEVVQSRVMAAAMSREPQTPPPLPQVAPPPARTEEKQPAVIAGPSATQHEESHQESQTSQRVLPEAQLDETQLAAIKLLGENARSTRELTDALKKSREHTARLMKELFEMGLVKRNDSTKPFIYELSDEGKRRLPSTT